MEVLEHVELDELLCCLRHSSGGRAAFLLLALSEYDFPGSFFVLFCFVCFCFCFVWLRVSQGLAHDHLGPTAFGSVVRKAKNHGSST